MAGLIPDLYKTLLDNLYDGVYFVDQERRITFWNKAAEQITGFSKAEVLGRRCADNLLRHVDDLGTPLCEESCPLDQTLHDGLTRTASVYLHHKSGYRLPVAIGIAAVSNSKQKIIGAVEIFRDNSAMVAALDSLKELENLAFLDTLTGIANRRYLEIFLEAKFNELRRLGWSFGVLFIDVDHFKEVNDNYGHPAGDLVLTMLGQTLLKNCRSFDLVGRWGGEEFLFVLGNLESEKQLLTIAERLRILVASTWVTWNHDPIRVTISLGATRVRPGDTPETLVKRADRLLFQSKAAGRNRITCQ